MKLLEALIKIFVVISFIVITNIQVNAATWYVRNGGSTATNCTGHSDLDYGGSGIGQPCAYSNLQNAIDNAVGGDQIVVKAGQTFVGSFSLPVKSGSSFITIKSSLADTLPIGNRVFPSNVAKMATIRTNVANGPAFFTSGAAHHYKFQGLEVTLTSGVAADTGILFGSNPAETSLSQITHDFEIDRCYIHGLSTENNHHGIIANGQFIVIKNSYISDWHGVGLDTQAILIWNSPGNINIINNYLEGAGENVLIGGVDPSITNLIPTNIVIQQNYFFKPLSWKVGDPSYAGIHWSIKNLLEIKAGRDITISGNIFENSWGDAQIGYGVLFTVRNQDGNAPWNLLNNITFTNNIIKNTEQGIQTLGKDNLHPSQQSSILNIVNNLFVGVLHWGMVIDDYNDVTIDHNTHFQGHNILVFTGTTGVKSQSFIYKNNITIRDPGGFGVFGDSAGEGTTALTTWTANTVFSKNVIVGANSSFYPANNFYPATVSTVDFVNFNGGDCINGNCSLNTSSLYHNAAIDGTDIGYNRATLNAATSHTIDGLSSTISQCNWNTNPACN